MVQGVDYRIPMAVKGLDISGVADSYFQGQDNSRRNALLEITQGQDARAQETHERQMQHLDDEARMKSILQFGLEMKPLLDAGDITGAQRKYSQRIQEVKARGGNPSDSMELGPYLQSGDVKGAAQMVDSVISAGQKLGYLQTPSRALDEVGSSIEVMIEGQPMRAVPVTVNGETKLNILGPSTTRTPQQKIDDKVAEQTAIQQQTPQGQADLAAAEAQADLKKQEAAQKAKQMQSAQEGVQEVRDLAVTLLNHPGRKAATGTSAALWTRPGSDAYDFETSFERFESMLTVDNLDKMSGVLTDKDIQILKSAAAGLKLGMSEDAFESELNRVIGKMNEKLGASQSEEFDTSLLEFMSPEERALFE